MRKYFSIALIAIILFATSAYCLPNPVGYVNDFAKVLSPADIYSLESRLTDIESNTGVEIAIVITNDLQNETLEMYSVNLFQKWGIGKKGADNGLLILLVPDTRQYRFEVGYGLEGILNDAKVGRFGRECFQAYFANSSYYDGFSCALDDIESEIQASGSELPQITLDANTTIIIIVAVIVFIILVIITRGGIFHIIFFLLSIVTGGGFGGGRSGGGGAGGKY
jgi:uncharacterized protein